MGGGKRSLAWVVMKIALVDMGPFQFVAARNLFGAACLFLLLFALQRVITILL